jgi:hypothetical protein
VDLRVSFVERLIGSEFGEKGCVHIGVGGLCVSGSCLCHGSCW